MNDDAVVQLSRQIQVLQSRLDTLESLERSRLPPYPQVHLGAAIGRYLSLPNLRAFWPMSSVNENGVAFDITGQGRNLGNTGSVPFGVYGQVPYASFDGATQHLYRADEAALDVAGALTIGGWYRFTNAASTIESCGPSKYRPVGDYGYGLVRLNTGLGYFFISSTGSNYPNVTTGATTIPGSTWVFLAGRFTPSTEVALFYNLTKYTNTTTIPASIFNSSAELCIGASRDGTAGAVNNRMNGYASMCFLCAAALSDAIISGIFEDSRKLFDV